MSITITQTILNKLNEFNFTMYQLNEDNYSLILKEDIQNHEKLFEELNNITDFLLTLNVDFLVDTDGSIIIK